MTAFLQDLLISARVAEILGDRIYASRSLIEAAVMSGSPKSILEKTEIEQLFRTLAQTPGDLSSWLQAAQGLQNSGKIGQTLRAVIQHVGSREKAITENELREFHRMKLELKNTSWICDPAQGVLIDLCDGTLFYIQPENPVARLIRLLAQADAPVSIQAVFEGVWKIRWIPERHEGTLKVTLSRFNKNPTSLRILRSENSLSLSKKGYICE